MRGLVILLISVNTAAMGSAPTEQPAAAPTAAETTPPIAIKRTEPVEVVYLEHDGPYWSLGLRFAQLRKYILEHNQAGPMFARFLEEPTGAASGTVQSEIGFIITGDHDPAPPFKKAKREAELVAYMVVGSSVKPARCYTMMREWIESNGHAALGPVTEVYPPLQPGMVREQRTEIQMAIRPPTAAVDEAGSAAQAVTPKPDGPMTLPQETEDTVMEVAERQPAEPVATAEAPLAKPGPEEVEKVEQETPEAKPAKPAPPVSVQELIAARQFERVAEQLLPGPDGIPQRLQLWLGQLVFRIGAAAKGIERMYPSEGREVIELADAITRRYKSVSVGFELDPLAQAVVRVDWSDDRQETEEQAVMQAMDALLGRIALKSVDLEETMAQLSDVVQRAQDRLRSSQAEAQDAIPPDDIGQH
jgi:effector-binding domain-containing protein